MEVVVVASKEKEKVWIIFTNTNKEHSKIRPEHNAKEKCGYDIRG